MNLYPNGFVVAQVKKGNAAYHAWPLEDVCNDKTAELLSDEAFNNWFGKYDMQEIMPDPVYVKRYADYCNNIGLEVKILLFESTDNSIVINEIPEIREVLGFDCIGIVHYSYLQEEFEAFRSELPNLQVSLNQHGLLDQYEDILLFIDQRKKIIASGANIEDFWEELAVRISVVNIT